MQMILRFLQIHLPKPNPCRKTWSEYQVALASTLLQINQSSCFKQEGVISTLSGKSQKCILAAISHLLKGVDCYRQIIDHMKI